MKFIIMNKMVKNYQNEELINKGDVSRSYNFDGPIVGTTFRIAYCLVPKYFLTLDPSNADFSDMAMHSSICR